MKSYNATQSWYPVKEFSSKIENYFTWIESVFQVQYPDGKWDFIQLTPHQRDFHSNDIAIQMEHAKHENVVKSRNTSFTTSAIIRLLTGNYSFRNETVPITRINDAKVKELIVTIKDIIEHMRPLVLSNGDLWPFDNKLVNFTAHEIYFTDRKITFIGYPASANASDNVRGLRITRGLNDETNFESRFEQIHSAMAEANRGSFEKNNKEVSYFQLTYGTTLRGETPYKHWKDKLEKLYKENKIHSWRFSEWPVFNPQEFNIDEPLDTQIHKLTPIVHWHSKNKLLEKYNENFQSFLEEHMAICVPGEESLYNMKKFMECVSTDSENTIEPYDGVFYGGVDVAGEGGDFFSISIFDEQGTTMKQVFLYYINYTVDLEDMKKYCDELLTKWNFKKFRVDGNGLGYHIGQYLQKRWKCVEVIRGKQSVKIGKSETISLKEYLHTNQISMISEGCVEFLNDEEQSIHYGMWDRNYEAQHSKDHGHGDIVISNALALLPDSWKVGGRRYSAIVTNETKEPIKKEEVEEEKERAKSEVKKFHSNTNLKDRLRFYKKNKNI